MGQLLSSSLKKPELLKSSHIIVGSSDRKNLYKKTHIFIQKIIPNRVIKDKNVYEITYLDSMYHLDGFEITTENDKVFNVKIFGFHPNSDPDTDIFCIPDFKTGVYLTKEYLDLIVTNVQTYYLDKCFFNPTGKKVQYKKLQSIYVQMNK